jgi:hypothetical protein
MATVPSAIIRRRTVRQTVDRQTAQAMDDGTTTAWSSQEGLRHHWYVVAEVTDVGPAPLAARLPGRALVLWRSSDGAVVAAPDRCPHAPSASAATTVVSRSS